MKIFKTLGILIYLFVGVSCSSALEDISPISNNNQPDSDLPDGTVIVETEIIVSKSIYISHHSPRYSDTYKLYFLDTALNEQFNIILYIDTLHIGQRTGTTVFNTDFNHTMKCNIRVKKPGVGWFGFTERTDSYMLVTGYRNL